MGRYGLELPVGPASARLFLGYRASDLAETPQDDEATRADKRMRFFSELATTFMPGTPLMQAPIGLAAYVPAVIDPPAGSPIPDEIAAIVYASRSVYDRFRETSLSRRMYTRSHVAVFDMARSVAQFPAALPAPTRTEANGSVHHFSFLSPDAAVDWQSGYIRIQLIVPAQPGGAFQADIIDRLGRARDAASAAGVDQILMACGDAFAAFWIHAERPIEGGVERLGLLPEGAEIFRDLEPVQAPVSGDAEAGVQISGSSAFTFRFERRLDLFLTPAGS